MNQWFKCTIKIEFEDDKGKQKIKRESYIVSAMTPTEVEKKLAEHLKMSDYEITSISTTNIVEIIN
jgi:HJR/Mrr/RecB family endonuclease